jgi:hypothetical protein
VWTVRIAAIALVSGLAVQSANAHPDSVSGGAFGASATAGAATVSPTPNATLPTSGGMTAVEAPGLNVPDVVSTDALRAISTGAISENPSTGSHGPATAAQSLATVQNVNILNGLITARLVVPMSSSTADGYTASSSSAGSALIDLVVNGASYGDTPAPNTRIEIPGVGTLIANEQVAGGDGVGNSTLTVNMLHLILKDPLTGLTTGDIVVGSAKSGVYSPPFVPAHVTPPEGCVFYTGGGRIDAITPLSRQDFGTFGFNATTRNAPNGCGPHGQLEYQDHHYDFNIHGISADITGEDGTCALFAGRARVRQGDTTLVGPNPDGTFDYSARACDNGEPGVGTDTFNILVPGVYDSTACGPPCVSGNKNIVLSGGNIQRHAK